VAHLLQIPQDVLLRWYSEECPGTSKCKTLFMLGEDAGSCLRIISNEGNKYNRALMGYVLQSHVRALVVTDKAGRVLVRSLIRLVLRSDTLTPVIFCDPMFFSVGYSQDLQRELLEQARILALHMQVPVVHAGSVLPVLDDGKLAEGYCYLTASDSPTPATCVTGYVRRVQALDYDITWVDLLEMDGVSPYTYSEELPYDDLLQQHVPGVQTRRDGAAPTLVIAALPRADSPSAARYVQEREGETAWTMDPGEPAENLPDTIVTQLEQRVHVSHQFDPNARSADQDLAAAIPPGDEVPLSDKYQEPSLDY